MENLTTNANKTETSQDITGDGNALIVFRKTGEDGIVVEERRYKIVGGEPQLLKTGLKN